MEVERSFIDLISRDKRVGIVDTDDIMPPPRNGMPTNFLKISSSKPFIINLFKMEKYEQYDVLHHHTLMPLHLSESGNIELPLQDICGVIIQVEEFIVVRKGFLKRNKRAAVDMTLVGVNHKMWMPSTIYIPNIAKLKYSDDKCILYANLDVYYMREVPWSDFFNTYKIARNDYSYRSADRIDAGALGIEDLHRSLIPLVESNKPKHIKLCGKNHKGQLAETELTWLYSCDGWIRVDGFFDFNAEASSEDRLLFFASDEQTLECEMNYFKYGDAVTIHGLCEMDINDSRVMDAHFIPPAIGKRIWRFVLELSQKSFIPNEIYRITVTHSRFRLAALY